MSVRNLFILLFASLIFASCEENKLKDYEGIWEGTFTGSSDGTWKIGIDEDGVAQGVATPELEETGFIILGSVNEDGELTMTASVFGRDVVYSASLSETTHTGSWSSDDDNFSGTWEGSKRVNEEQFPYGLLLNP